MLITRHQAQALLSAGEMELYDDSRSNPLRKLDAAGLEQRIARARRARDRSRDLVQRQKLASRAATGSKRGTSGQANQRSKDKAALLDDILKRFEDALTPPAKATPKPAVVAAPKKVAKKTARKTPARVIPRAVSQLAAGDSGAAPAKAPVRKVSARDVAAKKRIQAGKAKRKLQDRTTTRDRAPRSWQAMDSLDAPSRPARGLGEDWEFQAPRAAGKAQRPQAGRSGMKPAQGNSGTHGRRTQPKRDGRNNRD